jgi:hypothetical protein
MRLWVFQKNIGARRFYEHHSFRLEKMTDGSRNMEREPDALYAWKPERGPIGSTVKRPTTH